MQLRLVIYGESKKIEIIPENDSDKKLLEFVAEHKEAELVVKREYDYSDRVIKIIQLILLCNQDNS